MASVTEDLEHFVRDGLQRGLPRAEIQSAMLTAGWTPEQAKNALSAFADVAFPVPVPRPRPLLIGTRGIPVPGPLCGALLERISSWESEL